MARNTVSVVVSRKSSTLHFQWSEAALAKFSRKGDRYTVGVAYLITDRAGRDLIVDTLGAGRVRRALLVVAKAEISDAMTKQATKMAAGLARGAAA